MYEVGVMWSKTQVMKITAHIKELNKGKAHLRFRVRKRPVCHIKEFYRDQEGSRPFTQSVTLICQKALSVVTKNTKHRPLFCNGYFLLAMKCDLQFRNYLHI
jgi:hypothetical protein